MIKFSESRGPPRNGAFVEELLNKERWDIEAPFKFSLDRKSRLC